MKFYIAASYSRKNDCLKLKDTIERFGHQCTSRWLTTNHTDRTPENLARFAHIDISDIEHARMFLSLTEIDPASHYTGGRHTELGYAYARNKHIVMVGPREGNVFHYLSDIKWYENVATMLEEEFGINV